MKITIDIGSQEYTVQFSQDASSNGSGNLWIGTLYGTSDEEIWIRFHEKDGLVKKVERSSNVTTNGGTLVERIQETLIMYRESQVSDIEQEGENTEVEPSPYDPNKIKVRRDIRSIREIFLMMDQDKSIDLNPEFQRYFVWDNSQKSQFIESLLLGLPIPLFYFAENDDLTFNVVDGLQRLTTIYQYMRNEFPIKGLKRLDSDFNGKYFRPDDTKGIAISKALSAPMVRRVEGTQLVINIIEASSPPQVKFDIFLRINSGGKHLNNQEIRNCIATPLTRKMLRDMVHTDLFRKVTGDSISEVRMDDQELALRFIGFLLVRSGRLEYSGNMASFLNNLIEVLNSVKERDLQQIVQAFHTSLLNCWHLFGKYAFRKCLPEDIVPGARSQPINKSLFTTWTVTLSSRDVRKGSIEGSFVHIQADKLKDNREFLVSVTNRTNDRLVIEYVFKTVESISANLLQPLTV